MNQINIQKYRKLLISALCLVLLAVFVFFYCFRPFNRNMYSNGVRAYSTAETVTVFLAFPTAYGSKQRLLVRRFAKLESGEIVAVIVKTHQFRPGNVISSGGSVEVWDSLDVKLRNEWDSIAFPVDNSIKKYFLLIAKTDNAKEIEDGEWRVWELDKNEIQNAERNTINVPEFNQFRMLENAEETELFRDLYRKCGDHLAKLKH